MTVALLSSRFSLRRRIYLIKNSPGKVIRDSGEHYIAVVENHDNMRFVGTLHETDVMSAYNRALVDARREEHDGHL